MKDFDILYIIICIIFTVLAIFLTKWMFETVMSSDLPNWVKYMLLR